MHKCYDAGKTVTELHAGYYKAGGLKALDGRTFSGVQTIPAVCLMTSVNKMAHSH